MKKNYMFLWTLLLTISLSTKAQLSGNFNVPGNYPTIAAAVNDLNLQGVNGPVNILIASGYTELAPAGGYSLTASGTAANQITFQKSGVGANPLIYAYSGGSGTPSSAAQDGIWRFLGSDYITVDGINLVDTNSFNPATMEFGYGFFKASATDGCQNNTIKNCVITLNRNNNAAGNATSVDGSRGIEFVNALTGAHSTALVITAAGGTNSNNKIYSNTIQNCNVGIAMIGYAAASPFTFADTGNDIGGNSVSTGNSIINYGGGGTTSAAAAVRTLAQYNFNVSYNVINNNNGGGVSHATTLRGIYVNTAVSANTTINNNTLSLQFGGTTAAVSSIENASGGTASGNTISIQNNVITNCSNLSTSTGVNYGIFNTSAASAANLIISGNTFTNNVINSGSGTNYLIYNAASVSTSINLSNNNLSANYSGPSGYSGTLYNIYNGGGSSSTALNISNNTFGNYNHTSTGTGIIYFVYNTVSMATLTLNGNSATGLNMNHSGSEYFLYNSSSTQSQLNVTNNIFTNYTRTAAAGALYFYYSGSSALPASTQTFTGNLLSNISATVSGAGAFYGMYNSDGATSPYPLKTIHSNTLTNINVNTSGTSYGIYTSYLGDGGSSAGTQIYNNKIDNLTFNGPFTGMYFSSITSPNFAASVYQNTITGITTNGGTSTIYGVQVLSSGAGITFFRNKISDITANGATGVAHGIYASTSPSTTLNNNLIGNIFAPSSSGANRVNGIYVNAGTVVNMFYNTVYLNASSTGLNFGTNAVYSSTVSNLTLKNNIFVNLSTPAGTEAAVAYRRSAASFANYNTASNNNLFYAGSQSPSNLIFADGTNSYQVLSTYVSAVNPADANSVTENPTFQSTLGANANFLNINTSIPTQIESGGSPVTGITTDVIGTTRNASTPDIGAWEGNFTPQTNDIFAPVFLADGFTTSLCGLSGRTYTINLTDASGVASGSLSPRVYYSLNGAPYTSVAGSLTSGTALNGVWTFNLTYAANVGDVVSYFVVAQDIAGTPNLGAVPGAGFAGTSVNNVTSNPTAPLTYTINMSLGGSYNVGTAGTFTTLTQAVDVYNNACLTSSVTFVLTDPSYSANETFPIIVMNNPDASATNSLLVVPATGVNATVVTANPTSSTLRFLDARFITFDGVNAGGSSLSVANTHSTTSATIWIASSSGGPGNKNITLKNLDVVGSSTAATRYGILASQTAVNPSTTGGVDNDFISILNNTITNVYYGIYANGSATTTTGGIDNWTINGNTIGTSVPGSNSVGFRAIHISNAPGIVISNNLLQNIVGTGVISGIYLSSGIDASSVIQNTITNNSSSSTGTGTGAMNGIYVGTNVINGIIAYNTIKSLENTNATGYGARGIIITTGNGNSNINIHNNMISEISGKGRNTAIYWPIGIALEGSSGGVSIQFNSIHMNSSIAGVSTATASAALYVNTTGTANVIQNNIFANTYDNTTITNDVAFDVYSSAANGSNISIMDFNDYFAGGTGNIPALGYVASTQLNTIGAMQASFGGNLNSLNVAPAFISATDLHLIPAQNAMLDNFGTPVAGITIDIDGQTRSVTTPDMGADEFTAPTCTTASGGVLSSNSFSLCDGNALTISSSSVSTGAGTIYQWMQSTTPGGPYSPVSGGSGANTASYISAGLNTGTLYYVLEVTCTSASLTSVSGEATVVINPVPTASITSNAPVCQGSNLNLNGSSDIATAYSWNGPAGYTSTQQNPVLTNVSGSASGVYTLVTTAANCSSPSATLSVLINTVSASISGPATLCSGGSATLTAASSGTSLVWSTSATTNSIVVSPATTTLYDVTATSALGCTVMATHTLTVLNPTITGFGVQACGTPSASGTLSATAFGPINWYDAPTSTVVIGTGNTFVTPAVSTNTTFYAEANTFSQDSLTTLVNGTAAFMGVMFDIVAVNAVEINSFDMHLNSTNPCTIEIWHRPGSFVGFETSSAGWTLAQTTTLVANGIGQLTPIPGNLFLNVGAGQTHAFYIVSTNGGAIPRYTSNAAFPVGSVWTQNSDLQILAGNSGNTYFGVTTSPRQVNCEVNYSKPGCTSPRIPVTLTVSPQPTVSVSASSSTICAGSAVVLTASGASSYTWSNGSNGSVIAENPTSSLTYTVNGDNGTSCIGSETVAVTVNPLPTVSLSASQMTTCINAPAITLSGSPAGGNYSGTNVIGSAFFPSSSTGTFNPVYSYVDAGTGCSNSASVTIVVDACTGLDKATAQLTGLSVYPNPNFGMFTITLKNGLEKKVVLTDLTGRTILSNSTTDDIMKIDITDYAKGIYFVKIESNGKSEIYKIVKQ